MSPPHEPPRGSPRRDFLRLAVVLPVAVAGCATAGTRKASEGGHPAPAASGAAQAGEPTAVDLLRAVPLAPDVEPAFVFRAARGEG